jgi:hypothetical protein
VSDTGLLAALLGGCIGLVLSIPVSLLLSKWLNYRDMTRISRLDKRKLRKQTKDNRKWLKR